VVGALDHLWYATDYHESREVSLYTDEEMKRFLGEWIQVRKAGNEIFDKIRRSRPDLPGWDPIGKDLPVEQRLARADEQPESSA
jgi:hypothetical protein